MLEPYAKVSNTTINIILFWKFLYLLEMSSCLDIKGLNNICYKLQLKIFTFLLM